MFLVKKFVSKLLLKLTHNIAEIEDVALLEDRVHDQIFQDLDVQVNHHLLYLTIYFNKFAWSLHIYYEIDINDFSLYINTNSRNLESEIFEDRDAAKLYFSMI